MRQTLFQSYNAISNNLLVSELPDSLITNAVILIRILSQKGKTKKTVICRMSYHNVIEGIWTADDEHPSKPRAKESLLGFAEVRRMSTDEVRESLFSISDEQKTSKRAKLSHSQNIFLNLFSRFFCVSRVFSVFVEIKSFRAFRVKLKKISNLKPQFSNHYATNRTFYPRRDAPLRDSNKEGHREPHHSGRSKQPPEALPKGAGTSATALRQADKNQLRFPMQGTERCRRRSKEQLPHQRPCRRYSLRSRVLRLPARQRENNGTHQRGNVASCRLIIDN